MISPFTIHIPEQRLEAIRDRIAAYDWSQLPDAGGWSAGVGLRDLRRLVGHWRDRYDWRAAERRLNAQPHFVTGIEGERIHFLHLKGDGSRPPLLLLHGWPGSFLEFAQIMGPLAADGHDVVIPSLPGFAFSNPITGVIGPRRAGAILHALMARLFGARRYIVQGGDWGAHIASWMGHDRPEAMLGFHINMVSILAEGTAPTNAAEQALLARRDSILSWETGYNLEQETRPQTLGVALADSPVGVAGWILEKFGKWADLPTRPDGSPDLWSRFSEDEMLDHIMLYVGPAATVTASWIYLGKRLEGTSGFPAGTRVRAPMGAAAFPDPVFLPTPRAMAEQTYNVVHWTDMPRGGHFPAWEEPELMLADLRAFIATVAGGRG